MPEAPAPSADELVFDFLVGAGGETASVVALAFPFEIGVGGFTASMVALAFPFEIGNTCLGSGRARERRAAGEAPSDATCSDRSTG
jgi:hypothetical protein